MSRTQQEAPQERQGPIAIGVRLTLRSPLLGARVSEAEALEARLSLIDESGSFPGVAPRVTATASPF